MVNKKYNRLWETAGKSISEFDDELEILGITGMLQGSYNFRNITTLRHTKEILKHLDTVTSETIGLTYNVMDAINDELNEYVDEELRTLALAAIDKGWTFAVV